MVFGLYNMYMTIRDSTFVRNRALSRGGGALFFVDGNGNVTVQNCNFLNNSAGANGGAISLITDNYFIRVLSSTFTGNTGQSGMRY